MQLISTVTQKGQITIPKEFRQRLNIELNSRVSLKMGKKYLQVAPLKDILDLAGKYKPRVKKSVLKAREKFEEKYQRP